MAQKSVSYYPSFWQAVNLIVLYTFLQSVIDFPLALYDYQHGTDWLQEPLLKLPVFFGTTAIILFLGTRFSGLSYREIYPMKVSRWLVYPVILFTLIPLRFFMDDISMHVEKLLPPPSWFMELFNRLFESDYGIWVGILRVVVLAPVVEELIFRGVIFSGFQRIYPAFWAIFLSALLFALFHLNPWQLGPTFLLGLLLGYIRLRTGSLLVAIFTHALHNGLIFLSVYWSQWDLNQGWMQPGRLTGYLISTLWLASGTTLLFYLTKKKKAS